MTRRLLLALATLAAALATPALAASAVVIGPGGGQPGTRLNFQFVARHTLYNRGMNAALAIYRHYVYIGNRTDGSKGHTHPGVLVVDVAEPRDPKLVGEFGRELVRNENRGQTSRELRVWPRKKLLMVMYFRCSSVIHACPEDRPDVWSIRFFDLSDPVHPRLVSTYVPSQKPHEMFLWVDPADRDRALLYLSTPSGTSDVSEPEVIVTDISRARSGVFREVVRAKWTQLFAEQEPAHFTECGGEGGDVFVHSLSVDPRGTRGYLAYWCGHFLVIDTSDLAANRADPELRLLTPIENRPRWGNPHSHSAVKLPGRPYVLTTDEVYGDLLTPFDPPAEHDGCPWGWTRMISVGNPAAPEIVGEYKIKENTGGFCRGAEGMNDEAVSYASHNPTLTRHLALVTWHSGGLQAISTRDPMHPRQVGWFSPWPLRVVSTEDPALSSGPNKVVMWSYPIIRNGLIYVVDIRNGLYIVRYKGPDAAEVREIGFLEGNSNLGDALRISGS
ncbi:MAG: hypothetical protein M3312_00500 [Actinomycetota bacterium]|nr:hypothetical protein [Actinomycetota bacterium]